MADTRNNLSKVQIISFETLDNTYTFDTHLDSKAQISLGAPALDDGTYTGGTLTFRAKAPAGFDFEVISPVNSIDISAPVSFTIDNMIGELEITLAGFTGTAILMNVAVSYYE